MILLKNLYSIQRLRTCDKKIKTMKSIVVFFFIADKTKILSIIFLKIFRLFLKINAIIIYVFKLYFGECSMGFIFKIFTKKFALGWLILFAVLFLAYPSYLAYSVKEGEKSKSYSMVKYLEQTNETVYLNVGIQTVETKSNNTSIPWTKIGIPLTEKKAIIILNYQAKLGVKKHRPPL